MILTAIAVYSIFVSQLQVALHLEITPIKIQVSCVLTPLRVALLSGSPSQWPLAKARQIWIIIFSFGY